MAVSNRHILEQGPVIAGLAMTAVTAVAQKVSGKKPAPLATPTPAITEVAPPRSHALVRDFVRGCGGDPSWYRGNVPAHFFPQWAFPVAGKTLAGIPYPIEAVMNGGCRLEINGTIPEGKKLKTQAQLVEIDDNGRRAVLKQRIVTGTEEDPAALCIYLFPIIPLRGGSKGGDKAEKKEPLFVPSNAKELCRWDIGRDAGLDFAKLTGDFNPIHWVPPYAKAFGFGGVILHGFATMARAIEGMNRHLFKGDPTKLRVFDCQFTKPLRIPANVGLYVTDDKKVFVADRAGEGGSVYLRGSFEVTD